MKNLLQAAKRFARSKGFDIVRHKELPDWLHLHDVDVVLDIGANEGRYVAELREAGWKGKVVPFEPQPSAFARLKQRFGSDPNWSGHQMGLGSKDSSLTMNVHEMDVLSSFLEKIETLNGSSSIEVDVKRLDGIWTDILGENSRPFVKMDTQGFEMEIITGLGDRASEVIGWQIELSVEPLYKGQPRIEDVIGTMRSLEFSLWKIVPGLRVPSTLRSLEYDGIFFRNS